MKVYQYQWHLHIFQARALQLQRIRMEIYSNNVGNRYNQINFITYSTAMLISLN
ncbi:flagellar basal body protein [Orientia tsutsugamushi]|uniref:flagellar basal body protein n=1 Tax=Orientia tsutsugamushi TaxID=784 RepID=UPI0035274A70